MSILSIKDNSIALTLFGLLVISTGLGAVSLGGAGGGNVRLWELSLVAFVLVACFINLYKNRITLIVTPSLLLVAGYCMAVLLSGINAIDYAMWMQRSALVLAMCLLFYALSQRSTQKEFELSLKLIIYSGIIFSAIGILDVYLLLTAPDILWVIHKYDVSANLKDITLYGSYNSILRTRGFFTEPNEFSQYLELPFGYLLAVIFFRHQKNASKLIYFLGITFVIFAQVMSLSRGGLLGFMGEILGLFIVTKVSGVKWSIRAKNHLPIALVVIALITGGVSYIGDDVVSIFSTVADRVFSTGTDDDMTTSIRLANYQRGFDSAGASAANFLVGVGAGNLDFSNVQEATTSNQFVDVLVETGIIGLIFYVATVLSLLWLSYKFMRNRSLSSDNDLFVVFVGAFLSFLGMLLGGMTSPTHMQFFFWLNAGLLLAVCKYRSRQHRKLPQPADPK